MKNVYSLLLIAIIINISNLFAQTKIDQTDTNKQNEYSIVDDSKVVLDTLTYKVYGMDCPGCHSAVEKQINNLNVVEFSEANWVDQEVTIVLKRDSVLIEKDLFKKINNANFTPGEQVIK